MLIHEHKKIVEYDYGFSNLKHKNVIYSKMKFDQNRDHWLVKSSLDNFEFKIIILYDTSLLSRWLLYVNYSKTLTKF